MAAPERESEDTLLLVLAAVAGNAALAAPCDHVFSAFSDECRVPPPPISAGSVSAPTLSHNRERGSWPNAALASNEASTLALASKAALAFWGSTPCRPAAEACRESEGTVSASLAWLSFGFKVEGGGVES